MKKTSKIKRIACAGLVFLMSINSFAAIVSDNDGSAFITKSEFDALKSSFQSQIDSYNNSIDSKIDGAIASYLAGIKLSQTEERSNISYNSDGEILAVVSYSNIDWKEGTMGMSLKWCRMGANSSGDSMSGSAFISTQKTTTSPFTDAAVKQVDYTNKKAVWYGLSENNQYCYTGTNDLVANTGVSKGFNVENVYLHLYMGTTAQNNVGLNTGNYQILLYAIGWSVDYHAQTFPIQTGHGVLWREEKSLKNKHIICTPNTQGFVRFANFDEVRDWCNDTTRATGHTTLSTPAAVFDNGTYMCKAMYNDSSTRVNRSGTCYTNGTKWNVSDHRAYKPYFGFVQPIDNWNKIATTDYDSYIDDMLTYHPSLNTISFTESGVVKKHLNVTAGSPICFAKKDEGITLPLEFADKSKNYDVWIKIGSFTTSTSPTADTECLTTSQVFEGAYGSTTSASAGTASKSIRITNGEGKLSFKMPSNGYIFIKWSIANSSSPTAGGIYKPSQSITVLKVE